MCQAGSIAKTISPISCANIDLNFLDSWLSHAKREKIRWKNAGKYRRQKKSTIRLKKTSKKKKTERYLGWAMDVLHGLNGKPKGKRTTTGEKKGKNKMGLSFHIRSTEARMAAPAIQLIAWSLCIAQLRENTGPEQRMEEPPTESKGI